MWAYRCFVSGHIVFEMLFGEELGYATPDSDHYRALNNSLVVEVNVARRSNTFAVKKMFL